MVPSVEALGAVTVVAEVVSATVMMSQAEARQHIETIKLHFDDITALLLELDDRRGWEALGYRSMHQMIQLELKGHLNRSVSQIYRKVSSAKIRRELSQICEKVAAIPAYKLEPLGKLPPEQWQNTWQEVTSTAPDGKVSREHVQTVVSHRLQNKDWGGLHYPSVNTVSASEPQHSCWNCQHRLESVDNQSIYCNKKGILNLIDKSGDERGQECSQWRDSSSPTEQVKKQTFGLELFLPVEWQDRLEETAASLGIDAAVWVTNLIGASLFPPFDSDEGSDNLAKSCRWR